MKTIRLIMLVALLTMTGMVMPAHAQEDTDCPGGLNTRLVIGDMGRALETPVEIVSKPAQDGAQASTLPVGGLFAVLDGPVCMDDAAWWEIALDADGEPVGWISEWVDGEYVVEPLPAVTQTYVAPDASITFMYPADYRVVADTRDLVALTNSASGQFEPGSVMLAVYKSAYAVPSLAGSTGTPLELLAIDEAAGAEQGVTYSEPIAIDFGTHLAAYTFTSAPTMGFDSTEVIVGYGDDDSAAMVSGLTYPGEVSTGTAVVMALSRTLRAADADLLVTSLTQDFALADDTFTFNVRDGWLAEQSDDIVVIVNSPDVYNVASLDELAVGQLVIMVYPTVATISNYPAGAVSANDVPSTAVSFLASMGIAFGYTADGPITVDLKAGDYAAASWFAHGANHDRLVITAENGQGDFVTFDAYAAPGELLHLEPTLLAMLASVSAQ